MTIRASFWSLPTAVQLVADVHDTEFREAYPPRVEEEISLTPLSAHSAGLPERTKIFL